MTKIKTKQVLNFEYCGCGRHGHSAGVAGNNFWIYNDLRGNFTLKIGHSFLGSQIGSYTSYDEAVDVATNLFKAHLTKSLKCLINVPLDKK